MQKCISLLATPRTLLNKKQQKTLIKKFINFFRSVRLNLFYSKKKNQKIEHKQHVGNKKLIQSLFCYSQQRSIAFKALIVTNRLSSSLRSQSTCTRSNFIVLTVYFIKNKLFQQKQGHIWLEIRNSYSFQKQKKFPRCVHLQWKAFADKSHLMITSGSKLYKQNQKN